MQPIVAFHGVSSIALALLCTPFVATTPIDASAVENSGSPLQLPTSMNTSNATIQTLPSDTLGTNNLPSARTYSLNDIPDPVRITCFPYPPNSATPYHYPANWPRPPFRYQHNDAQSFLERVSLNLKAYPSQMGNWNIWREFGMTTGTGGHPTDPRFGVRLRSQNTLSPRLGSAGFPYRDAWRIVESGLSSYMQQTGWWGETVCTVSTGKKPEEGEAQGAQAGSLWVQRGWVTFERILHTVNWEGLEVH